MSAQARTEVLAVCGMHCGGCERTVTRAVERVPGVVRAHADFVAEEVEVVFAAGRADLDAVRAAVSAAGFTPGS
ncbi:MAG TPA: heavy-metal-associated domain-containing protein [Gaiellales bacterium]